LHQNDNLNHFLKRKNKKIKKQLFSEKVLANLPVMEVAKKTYNFIKLIHYL